MFSNGNRVKVIAYADKHHQDVVGMLGTVVNFEEEDLCYPVMLDNLPSSWTVDIRKVFLFRADELELVEEWISIITPVLNWAGVI